ncbi:MAG: ribosome small subunit-dependent GTPase A [Marinilabiliaceae bacterium]
MSRQGVVIRSTGSSYSVRSDEGETFECRLKGRMRLNGIRSTNPVAVGDRVVFSVEERDCVISEVCDRRNYIVRRSTNLSKQSHVIAANVDQALLVTTINHPETSTVFIDRFLASAEAYGVPVVIVFNKVDVYSDEEMEELSYRETVYQSIGYTTLRVSALNGIGIDVLKDALSGRISAIAGHSGVGKSTLVNTLEPGLDIRTSSISEANNSGRHTTTFAEMHHLSFGADIIDTPGIRGFGIINIDRAEVAHYFRDIFKFAGECRFPNCTHTHEPGCAVVKAVEDGLIAPTRYDSYVNIMSEDEGKYRQGY